MITRRLLSVIISFGMALNIFAVDWALYGVEGSEFHNGISKSSNPDWDNDYYGYIDASGKLIIPYRFLRAYDFFGPFALVTTPENQDGLIDREGNFVFGPGNYNIREFTQSPGMFIIYDRDTKKYGVFDGTRLVINIEYDNLYNNFPFVHYYNGKDYSNDRYYNLLSQETFTGGSLSERGRFIIYSNESPEIFKVYTRDGEPLNVENLNTSSQGMELFHNAEKTHVGIRNKQSGATVFEPVFFSKNPPIWINDMFWGYNADDSKFYLINAQGTTVASGPSLAFDFLPELVKVWDYEKNFDDCTFYDLQGNEIKELKGLNLIKVDDSDFLFHVKDSDRFYDLKRHKFVDRVKYTSRVEDGMMPYTGQNDKQYFYNTVTGKSIGPYDYTNSFNEGAAIVERNKKKMLIDRNGKEFNLPSNFSIRGSRVSEGVFGVIDEESRVRGFLYNPFAPRKYTYEQKGGQLNDVAYSNVWDEAQELFHKKKYALAMNKFYQLMMLRPEDSSNFNNYAVCLYNLGKYDEALTAVDVSLSYWPDNEFALNLKEDIQKTLEDIERRKTYQESATESSSNSIWDAIGTFTNILANAFGNYDTSNYYVPSYASETPAITSNSNSGNYEVMYRKWEQRAESNYNSLTNLGVSVTSKSGNKSGSAAGKLNGPTYVGMKRNLREAQREMRSIRSKAAKAGVNIPQSKWETATVSY